MYKSVYVKTHECFAKGIDCNEFYFPTLISKMRQIF